MFSFCRETAPEPLPPDDGSMREYLQLKPGGIATPLFGTPIVSSRFLAGTGDSTMEKPFEHEFERVQEQERSRRSSGSSARLGDAPIGAPASSGVAADESRPKAPVADAHMNLPVELLELIFNFLGTNADDDSYQPLGDLFNCALTCRLC